MKGRRREDCEFGTLPDEIKPGDYWKVVNKDGEPVESTEPTNLTHTVWMVAAPFSETEFGLGNLTSHTVREHKDGTISVRPSDGSSNSILISKSADAHGKSWHGYIEKGVWNAI